MRRSFEGQQLRLKLRTSLGLEFRVSSSTVFDCLYLCANAATIEGRTFLQLWFETLLFLTYCLPHSLTMHECCASALSILAPFPEPSVATHARLLYFCLFKFWCWWKWKKVFAIFREQKQARLQSLLVEAATLNCNFHFGMKAQRNNFSPCAMSDSTLAHILLHYLDCAMNV